MAAEVTFTGIETAISAEMTISRGAYPSVATLQMLPQETLDLEPGPLTFTGDGGDEVVVNCIADMAFLRKRHMNDGWRWSLQLFDDRKSWEGTTITGEFNRRISNGTIPSNVKKTAQELFTLLFAAVGNGAMDVSEAPATVYPYVNWQAADVQDELTKLCAMTATDICPQSDGTYRLCKLGGGTTPEVDQFSRHPEFKLKPRRVPGVIEVICGPDVFQAKFKLQAIGREVNGDHELIENLSFSPGWNDQHPWSFIDVSGDPQRAAAFESVWRYFRAYQLAEGGLTPGGCEISVTKMYQMLPFFNTLIASFVDLEDVDRVGIAYADGDYWGYGDAPDNREDNALLTPFQLSNDWGVIKTDKPIFKLDSNYLFTDPVLYLTVAFNVRTLDGALVRLRRTANAGGSGTLTLYHPEIFRAFLSVYDGANRTGVTSNANAAAAEADAYLDLFIAKFSDPWSWEGEYADIHSLSTNGKVAQVKWSIGVNRQALTHFGVNEEFDVFNLSAKQREVQNASR